MISHETMWRGIDLLCARLQISHSELARRAGLEKTIFHPSRRVLPDGSLRWPRSATIAKVCEACGLTFTEYAALCEGVEAPVELETVQRKNAGFSIERQAAPWFSRGFLYKCAKNERLDSLKRGAVIVVDGRWAPRDGDKVFAVTSDGKAVLGVYSHETSEEVVFSDAPPLKKPDILKKGVVAFVSD